MLDISLEHKILKEVIEKVPRDTRRMLIEDLKRQYTVSTRLRIGFDKQTAYYYKPKCA